MGASGEWKLTEGVQKFVAGEEPGVASCLLVCDGLRAQRALEFVECAFEFWLFVDGLRGWLGFGGLGGRFARALLDGAWHWGGLCFACRSIDGRLRAAKLEPQ